MKVKIKTWDEMVEEFGINDYGDITCKYGFVSTMERLLPEDRIIEIEDLPEEYMKDPEELLFYWESEKGNWIITEDMIVL